MDEKLLNDLLECSVCLERLDTSSKVLSCQHTFCKKCLDEIVATHKELRCPECRTLVECRVDELPPNVLLMRILEGMKSKNAISPPKKPSVACADQRPPKASKQVPYQRNMFARALYDYSSKEPGDLSFKKGDMIILRQKVDSNWYQGEANGVIGIFPLSYVQVFPTSLPSHIPQCKALYDFKMNKEDDEGCLSFSKGDIITVLRRIDQNWAEGKISNRIGIFPLSFVDLNQIARALMKLSVSSQPTQSRMAPPTPEEAAPLLPIELSAACQSTNTKHNATDEAKHVLDNTKVTSENTSSSSSTTTTSPNTTSPSDTTSSSPSRSPSHAPFVENSTNRSLPTSNLDTPKRHSFTNGVGPLSLGSHTSENKRYSAEILSQDDIAVFSSPNTNLEIQSTQPVNGVKDSKLHRHGSLRSHSKPIATQNVRSKIPIQLPAKHVSLYPYKPQKADELELKRGQLYMVTECCKDGWYKGTSLKTNCSGVFPGNYVTPAKISVRLLGKSSNNSSSVQEQKDDNLSFNGQSNDCSFQSDIDESLPLYPPPELPPRSNSPSVHSRVSSWLSEMPSTSRVRSAPTHNVKSMCNNTGLPNSTKPGSSLTDQDSISACVVNTVAGAVAPPTIASPSHSSSPENLAQKRSRKKCFLTNSVMRSFSNIKIRKSPPTVYSMDNPVFDDNTPTNTIVAPPQTVHTRSDSCPSKLLNVDAILRIPEQLPLKVKGNHNFKSDQQPNGSSVLIHHRKSQSLDTNNGVSVDIKPQDRKLKQSSRTQQNMCRCIVAYPPNSEYELELRVGDILYVHKIRQDGWYRGTLLRTGKSGLFPSSFVEKI
ncbi:PREDICTED: E3 ubiquitin-protein ligase SH3RF1 isoform X1 [Diuraphis noxia]|uniref:E3 ubiquitin-protein ligase SH3RF1 isoform X1 n=1 Tax=Diuraphis noxia TaxID=143948 RepID=UPI000763A26A|nr:PREDICTED: E3 ubiquitin-protein ligase SH3RF1 isoform X1 [Diuraphis noxia]